MTDYEKIYQDFWQSILEKDGQLDLDQLKRELYDYYVAMSEVAKVYDHITGGRLSKPNTRAEAVINEADEYYATLHICHGSHN